MSFYDMMNAFSEQNNHGQRGPYHPRMNPMNVDRAFHHPSYYRPDMYYLGEENESDDEFFKETQGLGSNEDNLGKPSYYHRHMDPLTQGKPQNLEDMFGSMFGYAPHHHDHVAGEFLDKQPEKEVKVGDIKKVSENDTHLGESKEGPQKVSKENFVSMKKNSVNDDVQISSPEHRLNQPFSPDVNLYNCPDAYNIVIALPGASSKSFKIDYHPSTHELTIKGGIDDKYVVNEKYLKLTELRYGSFKRTLKFPLFPSIRDDTIKAVFSNGLLKIKVQKVFKDDEKPKPKKIILIEDVPDEELEFEENPNPVQKI